MTEFYYLEHVKGGHMPMTRWNRGHTWSEPSRTEPPRLFATRRGAEAAAREWAQGPLSVKVSTHGDVDWYRMKDHKRSINDLIVKEIII